jgi:hypothetical protein
MTEFAFIVGGRIAPGIERDRVIALAEMAELRLVAAMVAGEFVDVGMVCRGASAQGLPCRAPRRMTEFAFITRRAGTGRRIGRNGLRNVGGRIAPGIERDRVIALAEMAELRLVAAMVAGYRYGVPGGISTGIAMPSATTDDGVRLHYEESGQRWPKWRSCAS